MPRHLGRHTQVAHVFATTRLTRTGGVVGTAEYMSPEQARGKRATKHSDLYSLGAVIEARRIEQLQSARITDAAAESAILKAWGKRIIGTRLLRPLLDEWREPAFEDFTDCTAWSLLAAFTHIAKPRQRRYPLKAALEVMKFQSLLTS